MAVRIVAGDAIAQPDYPARAKVIAQRALDLAAAQPRIARLHRAEEAFFGGQQQTTAIHVDAAAFEHQGGLPREHPQTPR